MLSISLDLFNSAQFSRSPRLAPVERPVARPLVAVCHLLHLPAAEFKRERKQRSRDLSAARRQRRSSWRLSGSGHARRNYAQDGVRGGQ